MFHAQAVQQRNQPGPGLVFNAEFIGDPGANLASLARQGLGGPGLQFLLLLHLAGCEFQAPQKCLRLIKVYTISFIP